ncbi:MAG: ABC transporter permease [Prevotellaceae bacterium]|jgi:ABC-type antimicrobial peptide transport system permease subunit|nr:ABC transporter permease [Prevotellaceae bacterium]
MVYHYLKLAIRGIRKYKTQNLFCILGLTIGLSAFLLGTYWWYWENHYDDFHPEADRIFAVTTRGLTKLSDGSDLELNQVHKDDVESFLQILPEIEKFCTINSWGRLNYKIDDIAGSLDGVLVDSSFFDIFYSEFVDGSYKNVPFDNSHIVITEKIAMQFFGKTNCAGEILTLENGFKKIAGVIKDYPSNTDFVMEFLGLSNSLYNSTERTSFYVKIHKQANIKAVRKKIEEHKSVAKVRFGQDEVKNWSFRLRTLPEAYIACSPELKGRFLNIQLLGFAGILALVCALMNALVLFIGQQQQKLQRNKIFRSMGASNSYLFWKSFTDLLLPLLIALGVAAVLIADIFPYYQDYTQWQGYGIYEDRFRKIDMQDFMLYSAQYAGIVSALFLALCSLVIFLLVRDKGWRRLSILRNILILLQIFIGCFFFFISLSLYKQVRFTQTTDKGIVVDNITQVDAGYWSNINFKTVGDELLRNPVIEDITFSSIPVLLDNGEWYLSYIADFRFKDNPDENYMINTIFVERNFFDFFGMKLKEGNLIVNDNDVVINNTQMQAWNDKNPLGKAAGIGLLGEIQVSGVIQDYYYSTMRYPIKGLLFHLSEKMLKYDQYRYFYIKSKPENREKAIEYAKTVLEKEKKMEYAELSDIQEKFNRPEKILFRIFGFLSLICILVVTFGIYSLVTLTIEQRKKEIAIRKVNGAEIRDILLLFIKNYLALTIAGNVIALPVAYRFVSRWLEFYVYRTSLNWWLFAIVFAVTCLIVLFSIFEKVRIAAKENPAKVVN